MKAVLNLYDAGNNKLTKNFASFCLYMLPIDNIPLINFYLDLCKENQVSEVLVIGSNNSIELKKYLLEDSKFGLKIHYAYSSSKLGYDDIVRANKDFFGEDGKCFYFVGCFFAFCHTCINELKIKKIEHNNNCGMFFAENGLLKPMNYEIAELSNDLQLYFALNIQHLDSTCRRYVLPGFNIEDGINIGSNVIIHPSCMIKGPVLIGDDVKLCESVKIIGPVVIGNNIIVDRSSWVENSVLLDYSYVGEQLEIDKKIVNASLLLDVDNETLLNLEDAQLTADIRNFSANRIFFELVSLFLIFCLFLFQTPLFILFYLLGMRASGCKKLSGCRIYFYKYDFSKNRDKLFYKLALDKYRQLMLAFLDHIDLVGETLTDKSLYISGMNGVYEPTIFISDKNTMGNANIDNQYYKKHKSIKLLFTCVFRFLTLRLFSRQEDAQ